MSYPEPFIPEPEKESWIPRLRSFGTFGGILFGIPIPIVLTFASGADPQSPLEYASLLTIGSVPLLASLLTLVKRQKLRRLFYPVYAVGGVMYLILAFVGLVTLIVPLILGPVAAGLFLHIRHIPD